MYAMSQLHDYHDVCSSDPLSCDELVDLCALMLVPYALLLFAPTGDINEDICRFVGPEKSRLYSERCQDINVTRRQEAGSAVLICRQEPKSHRRS